MKLTDYLAIYGAALSTAVFLWNSARARPKIKVRLTLAIETVDNHTQTGIGISIQNPSSHTAHITNVGFLYPYRSASFWDKLRHAWQYKRWHSDVGWCHASLSLYGIEDGCPTSIEAGKSHWIFLPEDKLKEFLEGAVEPCLRVKVQDALWRNKCSSKFTWDLTQKKAD